MSMRGIAALQAGLLLVAMLANAASVKNAVRITVLDSVTRTAKVDDNGVPKNCDGITFDAYCRSTTNVPLVNTLLVQEGDHPPFSISCTIESKFSRCTPLPKGETFDARREKKGITVYYTDDKGKARKEFYTLVDRNGKADPSAPATIASRRGTAEVENAGQGTVAPVASPKAPVQNVPVPAPAPSPASAQPGLTKVSCNFTSSPAGADITLDGKYMGNTPSEISLSVGTHLVAISMPGFAEWKRELTVAPDSAVNVTANLQKTQP